MSIIANKNAFLGLWVKFNSIMFQYMNITNGPKNTKNNSHWVYDDKSPRMGMIMFLAMEAANLQHGKLFKKLMPITLLEDSSHAAKTSKLM